ncbi:alpha/beta fold hydrolase [Methylosoma difficile]
MTGMVLWVAVVAAFVGLRPMSGHFLDYWLWKWTTPTALQTGHIESKGAHIHYVVYGQGEPVLLLHGGLSNKLSWFSQIPWLVAAGRRVVLVDTRGHGDSTSGNAGLNYQVFAKDALLVLDHLGITSTDIVGWSDGGITALMLGLEAPQRVRRIVAISANFNPSGVKPEAPSASGQATQVWQTTISPWFRGWWSGAGERHPALEAEIKALWRIAPQLEQTHLRAITAPTLVIVGEDDMIDLKHSSELASGLANGKLALVSGAGHAAPITHALAINQLIAAFLKIKLPPRL